MSGNKYVQVYLGHLPGSSTDKSSCIIMSTFRRYAKLFFQLIITLPSTIKDPVDPLLCNT